MFSLLALSSALLYGAADFIGGFTARQASTAVVVAISQAAGLVMVTLLLALLPPSALTQSDWIWSAAAGLTGGGGVALLYRALAVGVMAVVAPVTALCAVAVPVIVAIALGERPGTAAGVGMTIAMVAIVLVSQQDSDSVASGTPTAVGLAFLAGIAVGLFFLALARTSAGAGLRPLLVARGVSVTLFTATAILSSRRSSPIKASVAVIAAAGGSLDMLANLFYLLATRAGPLSVVVTLASLYPASTVMLARIVMDERMSGRQWVGVACALLAIVLIVSGTR
jgi:uncharacterized membrane protein